MSTALTSPRFHPGTRVTLDGDVHCTPLGYDRGALPVGTTLPTPCSSLLVERLSQCTEVEVAFHGKLGDTLLALSAVSAALHWLSQRTDTSPRVCLSGPHADLIDRGAFAACSPAPDQLGTRLLIADRSAAEARRMDAAVSIVCDPAAPPCWSSNGIAYPALPSRHYLAIERRLGVRLPGEPPFTPRLTAQPNPLVRRLRAMGCLDGIILAAIIATSRPDIKDYTAAGFTDTARQLAVLLKEPVRLLLIGGRHDGVPSITAADACSRIPSLRLDGVPAADLADLFPHCSVVVGNDTGLTHLAALSRRWDGGSPPVIGLFARHSHSKWRTGLPHHHAVATSFADQMHQGDLCPVRDALAPADDAHLTPITPDTLARLCAKALAGATDT